MERRKLPALCRVKRSLRSRKGRRGIIKRLPRNKKAAAGKFSRGGLYCDIEFLSVACLTIA